MANSPDISSRSCVVLLTGFGPFPGTPENVSAALVRDVSRHARRDLKQHRFHASILPTEWDAAPQRVAALIARLHPSIALHFGVAKDSQAFRIETRGLNSCRMIGDNTGRMPPAEQLIADAPAAYDCGLPIDKIVQRLSDLHLPVTTSDDAGGYLCNSVLFHTLHACRHSEAPLTAGFIHVPNAFDAPGLSFDDAVRGSLEIIKIAIEDSVGAPLTVR